MEYYVPNSKRRVFLIKLIAVQLVRKCVTLYANRKFIAVFRTARNWSLCCAR
jgi:hypothetical protein